MKKFYSFFVFSLLALSVQAQHTIQIGGCDFSMELNTAEGTAKIVDYTHKVDDHEVPMYIDRRKFKRMLHDMIEIPSTVYIEGVPYVITEIGRMAFADYTNVEQIKIPSTVHTIGDYAFFRTSVKTMELPATISHIGDRAFGCCKNLKRLVHADNAFLGTDVYTESKKIRIEKIKGEFAAKPAPTVKTPEISPKKPVAKNVTSDIDINLPVTSSKADQTFAIIIANENYLNDVAVDYALRDGRSFNEYCEKVLGLPKDNIRFQENATLNNMRHLVNWISNVAKVYRGKAQILVYYAGHGIADDNSNASLLPVDGVAKDLATGYSLQELYTTLGSLSAKNVCVFLDACFSGKQRNDEMLVAARGVRRAKEENPMGSMVVFSAAQGDETAHSYPAQGHGLFSYFLMKKLKETKGNVTLGELADYISENVEQKSVVVLNTLQRPSTTCSPKMKSTWQAIKLK